MERAPTPQVNTCRNLARSLNATPECLYNTDAGRPVPADTSHDLERLPEAGAVRRTGEAVRRRAIVARSPKRAERLRDHA